MNDKYFSELRRTLHEQGIKTGAPEYGMVSVFLGEKAICHIQANDMLCYRHDDLVSAEARELCYKVAPFSRTVREYVSVMDEAPLLKSTSGNGEYRLLTQFNDVILAGKEMQNGGYQFATWNREPDGNSYSQGHYYRNGYTQAKRDFAIRAGLVEQSCLFTAEQMVEMHRCIEDTLTHGYDITDDTEKLLRSTQEQISETVPDFADRIRAQQAHEEQAFSSPTKPTM